MKTQRNYSKEHPLSIFIVGGYGSFGARLIELLKDDPRLRIIVAGRSLEKAAAVANMESNATLIPAKFDRLRSIDEQFKHFDLDIIVDASGPFQRYADPHALPRAALHRGVHYIDLADSTNFVTGISALDKEAKEKNVFVLSGLSTYPSVSGAVLDEMEKEFDEIHSVESGVAPSPHIAMGNSISYLPSSLFRTISFSMNFRQHLNSLCNFDSLVVGESVIEAITSYAGNPVGDFTGILSSRFHSIRAPGSIPLGPMRYALVDVPDRVLLPRRYPALKTSWQGGGAHLLSSKPEILLSF